jgi:hypothetical protein
MIQQSFHDKKTGTRSTRINPFHSKKCQHSISLVPFLLCKTSFAGSTRSRSIDRDDLSQTESLPRSRNDPDDLAFSLQSVNFGAPAEEEEGGARVGAMPIAEEEKYVLVGDAENI